MYRWTLKYRDDNGANILNPQQVVRGFYVDQNNDLIQDDDYSHSFYIPVQPSQTYQGHSTSDIVFKYVVFYDLQKEFVSGITGADITDFLVPSGAYYAKVSFRSIEFGQDPEEVGLTLGLLSGFEPYFTSRVVYPVYKKMSRGFDKDGNNNYYRDKLDGNLKLVRDDYDYVNALPFDVKMILKVEDLSGKLSDYNGYFYKTDCKWDDDDRNVEIKTKPDDDYEEVLGGLEKTFNLIEIAPELEELELRRRPIIQVYIPGDTVITNILGGTYWEQELQIDPEFDHTTLTNTYKFFNSKNIRIIPTSYASGLSTNVTGEYDDSKLSPGGTYELFEEVDSLFYPGYNRRRYFIAPAGSSPDFDGSWNSTALYKTGYTNWRESGVNLLEFNGTNGETGSFYFTEYRIYVRYTTDKLDVRGTNTYPVPDEDIVANNSNYRRVIGYNIDPFYIYDEFTTTPTKFGKVPGGAPDAGKYYKEFLVSVVTGLSNPIPVSSSNWRAVSLWFFNDLDIRYTEFIDGQDFTLRDSYPVYAVIQKLLDEIDSNVTFNNTVEYSEFLYSTTNPLGGFTFLDFDGGTLVNDYQGNLDLFITPKSNIASANYNDPAKKADITLGQVLNVLRDVYKLYWHIDGGRLRIEHISWYQRGGTYGANIVGADLTTLIQARNGKNWGFAQNKWEFDKEAMADRYEYGWMDDVSPPFEGFNIKINSKYVQLGKIEDVRVNGFTTDIDYVQANPQEVSKDGFCLIGTVTRNGLRRVPFIETDLGYNQEVIMQNGIFSWLYLHPRYHVYDLPSDNVNINGNDVTLYQNNTRQKKQEIIYPAQSQLNPYQLIKTGLGNGILEKLTVSMESYIVKATIKHDTE